MHALISLSPLEYKGVISAKEEGVGGSHVKEGKIESHRLERSWITEKKEIKRKRESEEGENERGRE